jgi:hypothetical protein
VIIGWEVAEYGVMQAGVDHLSLTYGDTLGDLVLSTLGGAVGAAWAVRRAGPWHAQAPDDGTPVAALGRADRS